MNLEISRADPRKDALLLLQLDRKTFSEADAFKNASIWIGLQCFFLRHNDKPIASFALALDRDHRWKFDRKIQAPQSIFIVTTGILPEYQNMKLGRLIKEFQIVYARLNNFKKIESTARASNVRIISLNKKFGFEKTLVIPKFYKNPEEDMVVLGRVL